MKKAEIWEGFRVMVLGCCSEEEYWKWDPVVQTIGKYCIALLIGFLLGIGTWYGGTK